MAVAVALASGGCATRSQDIQPRRTPVESYSCWDCGRLYDGSERIQQRAADVACAVDARVGSNALAMTLGLTEFWPALMAMRPHGLEALELAELKGRHEAITMARAQRACRPMGLRLTALQRDQLAFTPELDGRNAVEPWRRDLAGNMPGAGKVPGAMAVDHGSGVLPRLDLGSNHPDDALWRRLHRVEPAASALR